MSTRTIKFTLVGGASVCIIGMGWLLGGGAARARARAPTPPDSGEGQRDHVVPVAAPAVSTTRPVRTAPALRFAAAPFAPKADGGSTQASFDDLERRFARETRNEEMTENFRGYIGAVMPDGGANYDIQCTSSVCRLVVPGQDTRRWAVAARENDVSGFRFRAEQSDAGTRLTVLLPTER